MNDRNSQFWPGEPGSLVASAISQGIDAADLDGAAGLLDLFLCLRLPEEVGIGVRVGQRSKQGRRLRLGDLARMTADFMMSSVLRLR